MPLAEGLEYQTRPSAYVCLYQEKRTKWTPIYLKKSLSYLPLRDIIPKSSPISPSAVPKPLSLPPKSSTEAHLYMLVSDREEVDMNSSGKDYQQSLSVHGEIENLNAAL